MKRREMRPATMTMAKGRLGVGADAGGKSGGQQAEAGNERGHHDGAEAKKRGFAGSGTDSHAFASQFIDVRDKDDGGFDRDAEQREQAEDGGDAEGSVREFQCDQRADRLGHDDAEGDGDGKFEVAVKREEDHEDEDDRERNDQKHLRFRFEELAVFSAPLHAVTLRQRDGFLTAAWPSLTARSRSRPSMLYCTPM